MADRELEPAVTCACAIKDGGGAQALRVISCIAFSLVKGVDYFHTPFVSVAHNEQDEADWTAKWESFFNFSKVGTQNARECFATVIPPKKKKKHLGHVQCDLKGTLFVLQDALAFTNSHPESYLLAMPKLQNAYFATEKPELYFKRPHDPLGEAVVFTVAVHIRRGDIVIKHSKNGTIERLVPCTHFAQVIAWLQSINTIAIPDSAEDSGGTIDSNERGDDSGGVGGGGGGSDGGGSSDSGSGGSSGQKSVRCAWDVHIYSQGEMKEFTDLPPPSSLHAAGDSISGTSGGCTSAVPFGAALLGTATADCSANPPALSPQCSEWWCASEPAPALSTANGDAAAIESNEATTPALEQSKTTAPEEAPVTKAPMQVSYHLNEDAFCTFHHLVSADVLVMSRSDFSYVAGIISKGVKLFCPPPFWHALVPGWCSCGGSGGSGGSDRAAFLKALAAGARWQQAPRGQAETT
jgi:hypothetical protein